MKTINQHAVSSGKALLLGLGSIACLTVLAHGQSGLSLYISAPGVQKAEDSGMSSSYNFQTEDFEGYSTGDMGAGSSFTSGGNGATYTVGPTGGFVIKANNQYGGNGEGQYLSVRNVDSPASISFGGGVNYFGMLWAAGDVSNVIRFYDNNDNLLATYSTSNLVDILENPSSTGTLTAIDGNTYNKADYWGQPVTGLNATEPYTYLHFINEDPSISIARVELSKVPGGGSFESDNHTVLTEAPDIDGTPLVEIERNIPVPEPSSALLIILGAAGLLRRRR